MHWAAMTTPLKQLQKYKIGRCLTLPFFLTFLSLHLSRFSFYRLYFLFQWPFVRVFGIQEPASFLFSILNFAAHLRMLKEFRMKVRRTSPMYWLWQTYALVSKSQFYHHFTLSRNRLDIVIIGCLLKLNHS